ncbi:hypothetical protein [Moorella sulfitireducens (nom. illeg.)]|uniref:hypothetical protein n=1 Tax=Neomoorella sulfitireducens TaxID=2972948 RepID=UPI0021ACD12F|nr:hypothetical protein [Moorella sulfitireducens]
MSPANTRAWIYRGIVFKKGRGGSGSRIMTTGVPERESYYRPGGRHLPAPPAGRSDSICGARFLPPRLEGEAAAGPGPGSRGTGVSPCCRVLDNRGSALIMALTAMALMAALAVSLLQVANNRWLAGKREENKLVARYLAEAGLERAVAEVRRDVTWTPPLGLAQEVVPGREYRYDFWQWDAGSRVFRLTSTGLVAGKPLFSITAAFKPASVPGALSYLLLAGDTITVEGLGIKVSLPPLIDIPSFIDLEGRVHAGNTITLRHLIEEDAFLRALAELIAGAGLIEISGPPQVTAAGTTGNNPGDFRGFTPLQVEDAAAVARPLVNLDYYRQAARDFGTYYDAGQDAYREIYTVAGRDSLVFVEGNARVYALWRNNLFLVATGDVELTNLTFSGTRRLTILAGGNIEVTNLGGKVEGVWVAGGTISGLNLSRFEGAMVARVIDLDGGLQGVYDAGVVNSIAPGLYFEGSGPLAVAGWTEMSWPPGP